MPLNTHSVGVGMGVGVQNLYPYPYPHDTHTHDPCGLPIPMLFPMSSALDKMVPVFTGSNWQQWHTTMQAYLRAQGQWFVYTTAQPADEHDLWDEHNEKALGNITLWVSLSIQTTISHLTMVKEVWDHLKENYSTPSIGNAYTKLSWLLSTTIPTGSHPAPAITKMLSHFAYLKDAGFEFPANVQAMVILCKLPPTMEVIAQILSQTSPSKIKTLKPDGIINVVTLLFEQKGASCGSGSKAPQANKLSTVKCKQADPKFAQQQQQGRSNGSGSRNAPAQGQGGHHCHGGRKVHTCCEHTQNAKFATYIQYEDGPVPTVDPHALAHTTGMTNYGPPAFDNTIKAFDLAHCLGVEPSCQTIHTLDLVISTASANLDQPEASPSSLHALVLRSTSQWMWRKTQSPWVMRRNIPSSTRTLLTVSSTTLTR